MGGNISAHCRWRFAQLNARAFRQCHSALADLRSVIAYDDYVSLGGGQPTHAAGKMRSEGKEYVAQDGDVILFRFNL